MASVTVNLPLEPVYNLLGNMRQWLSRAMSNKASGSDDMLENNSATLERIQTVIENGAKYSQPDLAKLTSQLDMYGRSVWVYIAVSKIARTAANIPLNVYKMTGENQDPIENHPIEQLLRKPSPKLSRFQLFENTIGSLQLSGNAYWFLLGAGQPQQIYMMRADRVRVVPGHTQDEPVQGYVYTVNGVNVPLNPEEVVHFKRYHPSNDYYGLSPLDAFIMDVKGDIAASAWNNNYFSKDSGVPAGLVSIKNTITDIDFERIQREWRSAYGGTTRKTAFIRGADVAYNSVGTSHKDMDFIAGRQFTKEEIMLAYGIPPGMLDKNATEANATAGSEVFIRDTIYPTMVEIAQTLTAEICPFYGDDITIEAEDIRTKDAQQERDQMMAEASFMTINEIRDKYLHLDPLNWGDIPAIGAGAAAITGQPIGKFGTVPKQVETDQADLQDRQKEVQAEKSEIVIHPITIDITDLPEVPKVYLSKSIERETQQFIKRSTHGFEAVEAFKFNSSPVGIQIALKALYDADNDLLKAIGFKGITQAKDRVSISGVVDPLAKQKTKYAKLLSTTTQDYLTKLQAKVIAAIRHEVQASKSIKAKLPTDFGKRIASNLDDSFWSDEQDDFSNELSPIIQDGTEESAIETADQIHMQHGLSVDHAKLIANAGKYATEWLALILAGIASTNRDGVQAILDRYDRQPDASLEDLVSAVQESYLFSVNRSNLIGETESTRIGSQGTDITLQDLSKSANIPILNDDIARPPLHGDCRCFTLPTLVFDDNDRATGVDQTYHTVNDAHVCPICLPLNGLTFTEIAALDATKFTIKEFDSDAQRRAFFGKLAVGGINVQGGMSKAEATAKRDKRLKAAEYIKEQGYQHYGELAHDSAHYDYNLEMSVHHSNDKDHTQHVQEINRIDDKYGDSSILHTGRGAEQFVEAHKLGASEVLKVMESSAKEHTTFIKWKKSPNYANLTYREFQAKNP